MSVAGLKAWLVKHTKHDVGRADDPNEHRKGFVCFTCMTGAQIDQDVFDQDSDLSSWKTDAPAGQAVDRSIQFDDDVSMTKTYIRTDD